jgi:hypothetical protein
MYSRRTITSGTGGRLLSKQLDRIEQQLEELTSMVGAIAWYFEEAMDYLAVLDEEILLIEERLGITSTRMGHVPRLPTKLEEAAVRPPEG